MKKTKIYKKAGKKGGGAVMAGVALGGITGAALGGIAGAMATSKGARQQVSEAVTTAAKYTTTAVDAISENNTEIKDAAKTVASTSKKTSPNR